MLFVFSSWYNKDQHTGVNDAKALRFYDSISFSNSYPYTFMRVVIFSNKNDFTYRETHKCGDYYICLTNVILSQKYPLHELKTLKKFHKYFRIDADYVDLLSMYGKVDMLEYVKKTSYYFYHSKYAIDNASGNGHIEVLDWWLGSGLPLKYTEWALDWASDKGHINVLEWWLKSGLPLKYSERALEYAYGNGHVEVLSWWFNSKLPINFQN
jgi:hypothetical protein